MKNNKELKAPSFWWLTIPGVLFLIFHFYGFAILLTAIYGVVYYLRSKKMKALQASSSEYNSLIVEAVGIQNDISAEKDEKKWAEAMLDFDKLRQDTAKLRSYVGSAAFLDEKAAAIIGNPKSSQAEKDWAKQWSEVKRLRRKMLNA